MMYGVLFYDEFKSKWLIAYPTINNYLEVTTLENTHPYYSNFDINIIDYIISILECDEYYELEFHDNNWYIIDSPIIVYPYMIEQMNLNKEFKIKLQEEQL